MTLKDDKKPKSWVDIAYPHFAGVEFDPKGLELAQILSRLEQIENDILELKEKFDSKTKL